ncbi:MAG TPA: toll/interleukin-1 receptor domain-containing protein [Ilumatobacteraceae bacterium]|nr:toll/interleukin-1 receptor domain-containing protein [Ilumatobacteraceae bacterium]
MPRLQQDTFKVFVSHKSADAELAGRVAEELHNLAPEVLECWVSGEDLTAGVDWDREIKNQLAQSHLLILLFTTPNHTWDWCLYEVGLFDRFDDDVVSVACLHDPNGTAPAPLSRVQCVRASPDDIAKQLVRPLCTQTWNMSGVWQRGALAPDVSDDDMNAAARRIAEEFNRLLINSKAGPGEDVYRYRPCHRIVLDLEHCTQTDWSHGIPRRARVVEGVDDTTSYTLSLFRAHDGRAAWTWGDLVDEVGGRDSPWLRDLDDSFVQSLTRHLWRPSFEVMAVWQPDSDRRRTYRPSIYEVVRRIGDDKPVEVTVLLVPDQEPISVPPGPQAVGGGVTASSGNGRS